MLLAGLIPDVPDARSAKRVLRILGPCPECGGQGWTSKNGYDTMSEQERCQTCGYASDLFWRDGVEYYVELGSIALDTVNATRHERGLPVCYGFWKMSHDGYLRR